jgi:hypothetical protein
MRNSLGLFIVFACLAQTGPTETISFGGASPKPGVFARFNTVVTQPTKGERLDIHSTVGVEPGLIRRSLFDHKQRLKFGYSLEIEASPDAHSCRISTAPLIATASPSRAGAAQAGQAEIAPTGDSIYHTRMLPSYPAGVVIHSGETFALELFTGDDGAKVVDHIGVSCKAR